jgi:aminopeptidase
MGTLEKYIQKRLKDSLGLKKKESMLILTDEGKRKIGEAFYFGAREVCDEAGLIVIRARKINREEPPSFVAEAMKKADVVVMATTTSFTHTTSRIEASKAGARIASMPGITEELIRMDYPVDYRKVDVFSRKMLKKFVGVEKVRVTTKLGTDISFSIRGRIFRGSHEGLFLKKGVYGNLPAGEIYVAPIEGTANGRIVVDASMAGIGKLREPIAIEVKKGLAVSISGGKQAAELGEMVSALGKTARNIAEFGIGTNPHMKITGEVLGDEKVLGTCHFALGDNLGFGGKTKAKCHLDGVLRKPAIYGDGRLIVRH